MKGNDEIKDFFSEKLGNMVAPVRPELWNGIASQIGAVTTTAVTTGLSLFSKWIIGISISTSVIVAAVYVFDTNGKEDIEVAESKTNMDELTQSHQEVNVSNETVIPTKEIAVKSIGVSDNTKEESVNVKQPIEKKDGTEFNSQKEVAQDSPVQKTEKISEKKEVKEATVPNNVDKKENTKEVLKEEVEKSITIKEVNPQPLYSLKELPNVFTPNGDGSNDYLFVESEGLREFNVVVLNMQNKVVYESRDINFKWSGEDMYGNPVEEGNYVYYLTAKDSAGNPVSKYSRLVLKR